MCDSRANNAEQRCLESQSTSYTLAASPCPPKVFPIANPSHTIRDAHWYKNVQILQPYSSLIQLSTLHKQLCTVLLHLMF